MIRLLPGDQLWDRYRVDAVGPEALDGAWLSLLRPSDSEAGPDALARYLLLPLERPARHPLVQFLSSLARLGLFEPSSRVPLPRKRRKLSLEQQGLGDVLPLLGRVKLAGRAVDGGIVIVTIARSSVLASVAIRNGGFSPAQALNVFSAIVRSLQQLQEKCSSDSSVLQPLAALLQPESLSLRSSDSRLLLRTGLLHTLPPQNFAAPGDALAQAIRQAAQTAISIMMKPGGKQDQAEKLHSLPEDFRQVLERCLRKPGTLGKLLSEIEALEQSDWAQEGTSCIACGFRVAPPAEGGPVCPCCGQEQSAAAAETPGSGSDARPSASGRMRRTGGTALVPREALAAAATLAVPDGMVLVPAGSFLSGERKVPRTLRAFAIDKVPVTEGDFKEYLAATRKAARDGGPGSRGPQFDKFPVTNITWHEANEFAEFYGKRLPTVYEWEKAARGADGRKYPFGNTYRAECGRVRLSQEQARPDAPSPVGSHPAGASPFGALDMAGNVLEWTCSARRAGERFFRAVKGACYKDGTPELARCTSMQYLRPETTEPFIGFRCVKDVD
ncbi:MAG TPA: SUMF1/EgtB/PvdO family nonheme iron enzyme [Planctomycetota bacterium]|nr:SUMF1/EgtB/PvdO family nonheme iron enzyme [Planctomycetota bacterium]